MKNTFFYGELAREVTPRFYSLKEFPHHICWLKEALFYGLKQAPHSWYHSISKFHNLDSSIFVKVNSGLQVVVLLYVDDQSSLETG